MDNIATTQTAQTVETTETAETAEAIQTPNSETLKIQDQEAAEGVRVLTSPTVNISDQAVEPTVALQSEENFPDGAEEEIKWFYADGIEGTGEKPEWFNDKTFKTLSDQAKAQGELRKKLAGFTGSPKEGYEIQLGEQFEGMELDEEDPTLNQFADIADELNMSQEGFSKVINFYLGESQKVAQEEEQESRNYWEEQLKELGPNGVEELKLLQQWSRNALPEDLQESFYNLITDAKTVKIFQALIDQTIPTQLTHVAPGTGIDRSQLQELMKDPRYQLDGDFQRHVDAEAEALYGKKKIFG